MTTTQTFHTGAAVDDDDLRNLTSLEELVDAIADLSEQDRGDLDWSSLPTFGGTEPDDTDCIWSWDATRLLVGEGELEIVERDQHGYAMLVDYKTGDDIRPATAEEAAASRRQAELDGIGAILVDGRSVYVQD